VFLEQSLRRSAPGWQALFSAVKGRGLLRLGDLEGAQAHALTALELLPDSRDSNFAYSPLATLLHARVEMGEYVEAAAIVDRPVPDTLHLSVHSLEYFRARARYYLVTHQFQAALNDLNEAGRLMKQWGVDRPLLLPWRTEAAEVLLKMGQTQRAERLVLRQLSMTDARNPWVRGTALRLRAVASNPKKRLPLLQQAITELRKTEDRVQLAYALADLTETLVTLGDPLARIRRQEALALAAECKAMALYERISQVPQPAGPRPTAKVPLDVRGPDVGTPLSESEQRVAVLAALQYTNREISGMLYITVSTVEQHLTRVYRKLNISRRQDLPAILELSSLKVPAI
jgi:DNA-binding CsgD family transcriptional regulator